MRTRTDSTWLPCWRPQYVLKENGYTLYQNGKRASTKRTAESKWSAQVQSIALHVSLGDGVTTALQRVPLPASTGDHFLPPNPAICHSCHKHMMTMQTRSRGETIISAHGAACLT
jgi:hypothetical protein